MTDLTTDYGLQLGQLSCKPVAMTKPALTAAHAAQNSNINEIFSHSLHRVEHDETAALGAGAGVEQQSGHYSN